MRFAGKKGDYLQLYNPNDYAYIAILEFSSILQRPLNLINFSKIRIVIYTLNFSCNLLSKFCTRNL